VNDWIQTEIPGLHVVDDLVPLSSALLASPLCTMFPRIMLMFRSTSSMVGLIVRYAPHQNRTL